MIPVRAVWNWAVASNERAVVNARAAATECSRLRVERADVEQFLAAVQRDALEVTGLEVTGKAVATGR
jgi:DnaJ-domain-containing protein 1